MTYDTITVLDASDGEYGMIADATTPPDAAATTDATMGSNQVAATVSALCF